MWHNWRKTEKAALFLLLILAGLALIALKTRYPVEPKAVYFVPGGGSGVALTFDTLWSAKNLEEILDLLAQEKIKATFFLSGTWLLNHPEEAKLILAGGHEIGNRTMNQRTLLTLDQQELVREIRDFNQLAADILEYRPRLFRPPLGLYNGLVLKKARQQGCQTVLWSVESYDWISDSSDEITQRVMEAVHGGAIIVFRLEAPLLPGALPEIVTQLRQKGYTPCSVSELLRTGGAD